MTARALQSTFLSLCWLAGALCQPVQCACAKKASHVGKHETSYRSEWFWQGSVYSFLTIRTVDLLFLNVSSLGNPLDITFYFIVQTLCQRSVNYLLFITSKGKEEEEEANNTLYLRDGNFKIGRQLHSKDNPFTNDQLEGVLVHVWNNLLQSRNLLTQ